MAPLTRSSLHFVPSAVREESWEVPSSDPSSHDAHEDQNDRIYSDDDEEEYSDEDEVNDPLPLMTMDDVQDALYPLKRVVERVGTQIEDFAQKLDQFKTSSGASSYKAAYNLVREYQSIAYKTAKKLRKDHPNAIVADSSDDESPAAEIDRWEQEAQTWDIFADLLAVDDPISQKRAEDATKKLVLHRYSTESEQWNSFLSTDTLAQEYVAIIKWLQRIAEEYRPAPEHWVGAYAARKGRRDATTAQGWQYTKEAIKAQKRLRSWKQPLNAGDPGIHVAHTRKSDQTTLVTQLDPDSLTRQDATLEDVDLIYEEETWAACYEMLRRGRSWKDIAEWCQERSEFWRAGVMKGAQINDHDPDGLSRFRATGRLSLWRQMCRSIARDESLNEYERAVYGILAGDGAQIMEVSMNWHDLLFASYNAVTQDLYNGFLRDHLSQTFGQDYQDLRGSEHGVMGNARFGSQVVERLKKKYAMRGSCVPFSLLQGAIIGRSYDELFESQGSALSAIANTSDVSPLFPRHKLDEHEDGSIQACGDRNLVRILAHMMLILEELGSVKKSENDPILFENNLVAYIDFLRQAGQIELIPLYASHLSTLRSIQVLSQVLIDVTQSVERNQIVKLMGTYNIDAATVLQKQAFDMLSDVSMEECEEGEELGTYPTNAVLDMSKATRQRMAEIKRGFIGKDISHNDEVLIRSLEWHRHLEGHWRQVCSVATTFYERCFALGRLATAREMWKRFPLPEISLELTNDDLSVPLSDILEQTLDQEAVEQYKQATPWRELEQLIIALDSLESWRETCHDANAMMASTPGRGLSSSLRQPLHKVTDALRPLIDNPDYLLTAPTSAQRETYQRIRTTYLPEILLAYNSVLLVAGQYVSRDNLLESMNLAVKVGESEQLTEVFVGAGRVRELVDGLAIISRTILLANEGGKGSKGAWKYARGRGRGRGNGERTDLWSVGKSQN